MQKEKHANRNACVFGSNIAEWECGIVYISKKIPAKKSAEIFPICIEICYELWYNYKKNIDESIAKSAPAMTSEG